ncbi:MAG: NAD(P)/FAD-dependent oxidoreductase [Caulobacter sp.]|nr:NAD(P)/FAD-dependent oxidoreductase [Caulobacter sp.]
MTLQTETEHFDVVIVGAGLSGVGAAKHLQDRSPGRTYVILEGRAAKGGTWDLFRYPGIRSDSDMYTLGYVFKPWKAAKAIADGPSILAYVNETAAENDIDRHIRYGHMVKRADWDSATAAWTVEAEVAGKPVRFTCNFLFMCSGYYSYKSGYKPEFAGAADFKGTIVHPQEWPADLDHAGKKVVVIGSGATAVTLVPEMARTAAHVTMLQRSPTYVVSRPAEDPAAEWLKKTFKPMTAYRITRWKNVLLGMVFFRMARKRPERVKEQILGMVREKLGPDYDVATHFTPRYNPWDQRLCLVPDDDLFNAINTGAASVVTDHIERFTPKGILLKSGQELEADIIVTATGLNLEVLGGAQFAVDGEPVNFGDTLSYKGMMYSGVPNLASSFGYTNASWTLKADLTCAYVCRLLNHMTRTGQKIATPVRKPGDEGDEDWLDFSSGYVQRSVHLFPKQGAKAPWKQHQNYALDLMSLKFGRVDDGAMIFSNPPRTAAKAAAKVAQAA